MEVFETLLDRSVQHHGHLCPGQIIGVRMAMLGCRLIGIEEPTKEIKKLIVFKEVLSDGRMVCRPCPGDTYFLPLRTCKITFEQNDVNAVRENP